MAKPATAKKSAAKPPSQITPATQPAQPAPEAQGSNMKLHKSWTGTLTFGLVSLPIALYTGAREETISFNQIHDPSKPCGGQKLKRLGMECPQCGPVKDDEIVKGYARDGGFIVVTDEERDNCKPDSAKVVEIVEFVPLDQLDPVYFEESYYLAPMDGGAKQFALVRAAMVARSVCAIAKIIMSSREHLVAIRPYGERGMMLHKLFFADEIRPMVFPALYDVNPKELTIAGGLIDALLPDGAWNPAQYHDEYRAAMLQLIESKAQGKSFALPKAPTRAAVVDITDALLQSIDVAKKKKVARAS